MSKVPHKPIVEDPVLQKWINHVHKAIEDLPQHVVAAPGLPSGLKVTPGPGMNRVTFTGGQGATGHLILASPSPIWDPSLADHHMYDIGRATEFPHVIGIPAQTHYYWVIAVKGGLRSYPPVGPIKGTTLALNTPASPPPAVRAQPGNLVRDARTQLPTLNVRGLTRTDQEP